MSGRGDRLGDDLRTERERAVLDGDDRHALLGTWASGVNVIDPVMPGNPLVSSRAVLTACASVEPARVDRVGQQVDRVVAERRERVLERVAELRLVCGR